MTEKILLLENYRQTITVVRSLAKAGHEIILGKSGHKAFTEFSRYSSDVWEHPPFENTDAFIRALKELLGNKTNISFIYPVGEISLKILAENRGTIPSRFGIVMPEPSTVLACLDKTKTYKLVKELDIPLPVSKTIHDYNELQNAAIEIGFPLIAKPNSALTQLHGKKALIFQTIDELNYLLPAWPENTTEIILQSMARGYRHNCHFVATKGVIRSIFETKVLRTDTPNNTGYGVDSISLLPSTALVDYTVKLVGALNYTGIGCAQYLVENDKNNIHFLEINPRLDANCALPYLCGYDFPCWGLEVIKGTLEIPPTKKTFFVRIKRAHWLHGDLMGLLASLKTHEIMYSKALNWFFIDIPCSLFKANYHITWSWLDPFPTLFQYAMLIKSIFKNIFYIITKKKRESR